MVPKITKGRSATGALRYDHGKGRREEHENPHKVAGNVAGRSWRERARAMDDHARTARPDVKRPIHRTALRLAPEDRKLTDREWRQVAERYVHRMGYRECPWEATRHAGDHIHITVSRVRWDGTLAKDSHDYAKAQSACREIERRHQLVNASERFQRSEPQITRPERESAQRRSTTPERQTLRERIRSAERGAGGTREGYEAALRREGVSFRANVASTGRVSGYSYGLDGHRDRSGEQIFFKGSQLGKDFAWSRSQRRMGFAQHAERTDNLRPMSRGQAREQAQRTAAERSTGSQEQKGRPRLVRAGSDNAARADAETSAPRRQMRNAQENGEEERMAEGSSAKKPAGPAQAMTREQAARLAAEAAQRRQQDQQRQQEHGRGMQR